MWKFLRSLAVRVHVQTAETPIQNLSAMEREAFLRELRSSSDLKNAPKIADRKFLTVDGSRASDEESTRFSVMHFNTLAKALSSPEVGKFEMLEEGALEWPFRRARVAIQWTNFLRLVFGRGIFESNL